MARNKYVTLSTGYKVKLDEPDTDQHLTTALVGECMSEIRDTTKPFSTIDELADAAARRLYQECEYLSRRYDLALWRLLGSALEFMRSTFELREKLGGAAMDADCDNCENRDECAQNAREQCSPEDLN